MSSDDKPHDQSASTDVPTDVPTDDDPAERRGFLARAAGVAMAGGLVAGYGTFFTQAGRFLFPARAAHAWYFVTQADAIAPGDSLTYESPDGVEVVIKRAAAEAAAGEPNGPDGEHAVAEPRLEEFLALSSVCPHLGCRVHWEAHNDRFFCPCHNGEFDPQGRATGGPPLAANQSLPQYPLMIEHGLLFIEMPLDSVRRGRRLTPLGSSTASHATTHEPVEHPTAGSEAREPTRWS